jgi:hypothetical protein
MIINTTQVIKRLNKIQRMLIRLEGAYSIVSGLDKKNDARWQLQNLLEKLSKKEVEDLRKILSELQKLIG